MSENTRLFHKRAFLNDETGAAMVEARLTDNCSSHNNERRVSVDGEMHITDCSRSIQLELYFSDIEEARAQLRKLDRLIDTAHGMREAIVRVARREFPGKKL